MASTTGQIQSAGSPIGPSSAPASTQLSKTDLAVRNAAGRALEQQRVLANQKPEAGLFERITGFTALTFLVAAVCAVLFVAAQAGAAITLGSLFVPLLVAAGISLIVGPIFGIRPDLFSGVVTCLFACAGAEILPG